MSKPAQTPQQTSPKKETTVPTGGPSKGDTGGRCAATECKSPEKRFSFCDEHFDQFKFGLIKKDGTPVSDYEKKFGHYQAYKQRLQTAARKAA
jgi:hypothetical protein